MFKIDLGIFTIYHSLLTLFKQGNFEKYNQHNFLFHKICRWHPFIFFCIISLWLNCILESKWIMKISFLTINYFKQTCYMSNMLIRLSNINKLYKHQQLYIATS